MGDVFSGRESPLPTPANSWRCQGLNLGPFVIHATHAAVVKKKKKPLQLLHASLLQGFGAIIAQVHTMWEIHVRMPQCLV